MEGTVFDLFNIGIRDFDDEIQISDEYSSKPKTLIHSTFVVFIGSIIYLVISSIALILSPIFLLVIWIMYEIHKRKVKKAKSIRWISALGDEELPDYDVEVVAILVLSNGLAKPVIAHRPDPRSDAEVFGPGGWNIEGIVSWLRSELPVTDPLNP